MCITSYQIVTKATIHDPQLHLEDVRTLERNVHENRNYLDNLDTYHLDSPPSKKSKCRSVSKSLREPSTDRISAQTMITRGELQRGVSPKFTRKLIGTVIKEEKETKPKIKDEEEEDQNRNT